LEFEGNPKLCATGPCNSSSGNKETTVIAPVAAAIAIFIAVLVLIIVFIKKRPSSIRALHPSRANLSLENKKRRITYSEILLMTNNFERVIGEGGFVVISVVRKKTLNHRKSICLEDGYRAEASRDH
jgi:hypothetical protein